MHRFSVALNFKKCQGRWQLQSRAPSLHERHPQLLLQPPASTMHPQMNTTCVNQSQVFLGTQDGCAYQCSIVVEQHQLASIKVSPPSPVVSTSKTAKSVMMRFTTRVPVRGNEQLFRIFGFPCRQQQKCMRSIPVQRHEG